MKKIIVFLLTLVSLSGCDLAKGIDGKEHHAGEYGLPFAKGADISWVTEMEANGYCFYDRNGSKAECTAILKDIGFNAVRLRVWVNPSDGWCSKEDVLEKASRAKALGMNIMIDFHYSDWWADPQKQNVPAKWESFDIVEMTAAVSRHTSEVLEYLKDNGIQVDWIQIGNEVENGMLWESGRVSGQKGRTFTGYFNAGAAAARAVYPDAYIILHISNAWKSDTLVWFYDLMEQCGADYDMIGLSLYPSYWEDGAYKDWRQKAEMAVANIKSLSAKYSRPVMLVEFGMPASQPDKAKECLQYILDNTEGFNNFKGIFYWEPESEHSRNYYDYGAFSNGMPTEALDPFKRQILI